MLHIGNYEGDTAYIFIHGLYDNLWSWKYIVDSLQGHYQVPCYLISLPGYYNNQVINIYKNIESIAKKYDTVKLVGFSLGAIIASEVAEKLKNKQNIELFMISIPMSKPRFILNIRHSIDLLTNKYLVKATFRKQLPIFLRGKLGSSYFKTNLINKASFPMHQVAEKASNANIVYIASGGLDPIASNVKEHKFLTEKIESLGTPSSFTYLGLTSHLALYLSPQKIVAFISQ